MKKLILSMFVVLGTMASVSAQSFNFVCRASTTAPVDAAFSQEQAVELETSGFEAEDEDSGRFQIYRADLGVYVLIINNGDGTFTIQDDDGEIEETADSLEAAMLIANPPSDQAGYSLSQDYELTNDGLDFGTYAVNGAQGMTETGYQGSYIAEIANPDNSGTTMEVEKNFLLSYKQAVRELHGVDGNVIGVGTFYYRISGWNITPEYFVNIEEALERAMELNTIN